MRNSYSRITNIFLCVLIVIISTGCSTGLNSFQDGRGKFQVDNNCVDLSANMASSSLRFPGTIWYTEYPQPYREDPKEVHWITSDPKDKGSLPLDDVERIITSPDGKIAVFAASIRDENGTVLGTKIYYVEGRQYREVVNKKGDSLWALFPILTIDGLLMGTYSNYDYGDNDTISVRIIDLSDGELRQETFSVLGLSGSYSMVSHNGILAYRSYKREEGSRLKLIDMNTKQEIAQYQGISFKIKQLSVWSGYDFNQQGTRILAIAPPQTAGPFQQELFGVEIGKNNQPVQVTDFLSRYPYILLHDDFSWSPNDRWVVIRALLPTAEPTSLEPYIKEQVSTSFFLIDLEKSIAYKICQEIGPREWNLATWSPDSRYFALSINDKMWVVDPETLESRLLAEKTGVPLRVLGWTTP